MGFISAFKVLNPVCHLLALLGAHHILHVSGIRVNIAAILAYKGKEKRGRKEWKRKKKVRNLKIGWEVNIHSGDLILLGCYILSTGKTLPTLWKVAVLVLVGPEDDAIMILKTVWNFRKFTC